MLNDQIYQAYLEEMEALETFRMAHRSLHRNTPLELVEDPDTMRLVESLAFFSARSRIQGLNQIAQIHQVLFRQCFSFLINPLPSMGLVQMQPSLRIPETLTLAQGTELSATTYDERRASMQTLETLKIYPLFPDCFHFNRRVQGGWNLEIRLKSFHVQNEDLDEMTFYINHLNSFHGSIRTYFALCRCMQSVEVFFDQTDIRNKTGILCETLFSRQDHRKVFNHPLEYIRSCLHFPEQEMFIKIKIPPQAKKWETVTFFIQLSEAWPEQLQLTQNSLVPYVVPIANIRTAKGEPIHCNGTKDSYPILYPNPVEGFSLHTVLGVYEVVPEGMRSLKPGILDKRGRTYEIDFLTQQIFLDLPKAFQNPRKVSVDALWTQLWFTDYIDQEFKLSLKEKQMGDLSPKLLQQMREHEISFSANDPKFLLRILSLKNQNRLSVSELMFLMNGLKNLNHSYFKFVPELIMSLNIADQIDRAGMGPVIRYAFQLKEWDGNNWEIVVLFFKYLNGFLNCWLSNFHVETAVFFPHSKTPLIFKGEKDDELSILARNFFVS